MLCTSHPRKVVLSEWDCRLLQCLCFAQSENLRDLEIVFRILRSEIAHFSYEISRLHNCIAPSLQIIVELHMHTKVIEDSLVTAGQRDERQQDNGDRRQLARQHLSDLLRLLTCEWDRRRQEHI